MSVTASFCCMPRVIAALFLLQFVASDYAVLTLTRIMVLAIYAVGYNILFGYAGLLSLGHAMFFAAGLYAAALGVTRLGLGVPEAFLLAIAHRRRGVAGHRRSSRCGPAASPS